MAGDHVEMARTSASPRRLALSFEKRFGPHTLKQGLINDNIQAKYSL